jgi:hypothetical protein
LWNMENIFHSRQSPLTERGRSAHKRRVGVNSGGTSPAWDGRHAPQAQLVDLCGNNFQHAIHIFNNVGIPEPKDRHPLSSQPFIAHSIASACLRMLSAVQLNGETQYRAVEVQNITAGRMLSAKLRVGDLAVPQPVPELCFHIGAIAPQLPDALCLHSRPVEPGHVDPHPALTRRPPPFRGRYAELVAPSIIHSPRVFPR